MTKSPPRSNITIHLGRLLLLLAALAGLAWYQRPDGNLHVVFLDTSGDAVLIQTPRGEYVLIDGGADPIALPAAMAKHMPFWQRHLAAVVLTNGGGQHLPGQVAALARYEADVVWSAITPRRTAMSVAWQQAAQQLATPIRALPHGRPILIDGVQFTLLLASDQGGIIQLRYGATTVILAHNATDEQDDLLLAQTRAATLVAFPWRRDPHTAWLHAAAPRYLVFTDGFQTDTPARLSFFQRQIGTARLFHEAINGTITLISDGRTTSIRTERR